MILKNKRKFILYQLLMSTLILFAFAVVSPQQTHSQIDAGLCGGTELQVNTQECKDATLNAQGRCIDNATGGQINRKFCPEGRLNDVITNIVNVLSVIVGIVAVIMIIIGGFKYITSGGDSGSITSAKHTIIYAIVGLVVVALSQFIVRYVLDQAT
jgi:hypothetical protein